MQIDKEQEKFLDEPDIKLNDIDKKASIKSNENINQSNWVTLVKWLIRLKTYIRYLRSLIDIDAIVGAVIDKLSREKPMLTIPVSMQPDSKLTQISGKKTYQLHCLDNNTVEITNLTDGMDWVVDRLMVTVKNAQGIIVYPVITTFATKITINFSDGIASNYSVYMI